MIILFLILHIIGVLLSLLISYKVCSIITVGDLILFSLAGWIGVFVGIFYLLYDNDFLNRRLF